MERAVRWGIWGTGSIAHEVARDFRLAKCGVLHAVASRTGQHAKQFASEHSIAKWHGGLQSLLEDPEIDVIYVATPNHCHVADCLACINAGKAVLCEKPLALNLEQAHSIANAARLQKVFCMEAMWTRFIPAVREVKRRIDSNEIGSPRLMQGNFAYIADRTRDRRLFDDEMGGGALLDRGVYLISLAQHLLGSPDQICGVATIGATGVDEQSSYQLVFGGALADLAASLTTRGSNDLVISGDRGSFRFPEPFFCADRYQFRSFPSGETHGSKLTNGHDGPGGLLRRLRNSPAAKLVWRRLKPLAGLYRRGDRVLPFPGSGYQFELMEVNRCIRENLMESSTMPLSDSLEVMKIMDTLRLRWNLVCLQER